MVGGYELWMILKCISKRTCAFECLLYVTMCGTYRTLQDWPKLARQPKSKQTTQHYGTGIKPPKTIVKTRNILTHSFTFSLIKCNTLECYATRRCAMQWFSRIRAHLCSSRLCMARTIDKNCQKLTKHHINANWGWTRPFLDQHSPPHPFRHVVSR